MVELLELSDPCPDDVQCETGTCAGIEELEGFETCEQGVCRADLGICAPRHKIQTW